MKGPTYHRDVCMNNVALLYHKRNEEIFYGEARLFVTEQTREFKDEDQVDSVLGELYVS